MAHGSGDADEQAVDGHNRVVVPPDAPAYTLRRVWLSPELEQEYYYGFANEALWPLCHAAYHQPRFSEKNWSSYRKANQIFADAILEEADGQAAVVFVQDYHLALLPQMLKRGNPRLIIAHFWHIPWPNREAFRVFPWKDELLDGMLANDLLGFHLEYHCANFFETIERLTDVTINIGRGQVNRSGHCTAVQAFPISIDFEAQARMAGSRQITAETARWWQEFAHAPEILGIGVDRIDYTKGIPHRLRAIDHLLEEHPEYLGRLVFLQVGVPSRTSIKDYDSLNQSLITQVDEMNSKWARGSWKPVIFVRRHVDPLALTALYLMADFCVVSSLHDGMNLVAKEFVASRIDGDGVLILSAFTGAARELTDALIVNPFAIHEMTTAIRNAINMPCALRRRRMNAMRAVIAANNVYTWAGTMLTALSEIALGAPAVHANHVPEERVLAKAAQ